MKNIPICALNSSGFYAVVGFLAYDESNPPEFSDISLHNFGIRLIFSEEHPHKPLTEIRLNAPAQDITDRLLATKLWELLNSDPTNYDALGKMSFRIVNVSDYQALSSFLFNNVVDLRDTRVQLPKAPSYEKVSKRLEKAKKEVLALEGKAREQKARQLLGKTSFLTEQINFTSYGEQDILDYIEELAMLRELAWLVKDKTKFKALNEALLNCYIWVVRENKEANLITKAREKITKYTDYRDDLPGLLTQLEVDAVKEQLQSGQIHLPELFLHRLNLYIGMASSYYGNIGRAKDFIFKVGQALPESAERTDLLGKMLEKYNEFVRPKKPSDVIAIHDVLNADEVRQVIAEEEREAKQRALDKVIVSDPLYHEKEFVLKAPTFSKLAEYFNLPVGANEYEVSYSVRTIAPLQGREIEIEKFFKQPFNSPEYLYTRTEMQAMYIANQKPLLADVLRLTLKQIATLEKELGSRYAMDPEVKRAKIAGLKALFAAIVTNPDANLSDTIQQVRSKHRQLDAGGFFGKCRTKALLDNAASDYNKAIAATPEAAKASFEEWAKSGKRQNTLVGPEPVLAKATSPRRYFRMFAS